MTPPSPERSSSSRCEVRHECEMASEAEHAGGCPVSAACQSSGASKASPSTAISASQNAGIKCYQSDVPATNSNSQQSEFAVPDGTMHVTDASRVNIDDLPDDMLVKIFSHLSFCELTDVVPKVCPRWRRVSQDFEVWVDKEYHIRDRNCTIRHNIIKCGKTDQEAIQTFSDVPHLRILHMHRGATSPLFDALGNRCRGLSVLRLSAAQKFSYSVLKRLVEKCSRIHTLRIYNNLLKSKKLSQAVSHLKHLQVLEIARYTSNSVPQLRPLADGCPQLAEVDFRWTTINMDDLSYFLKAKKNTLKSIHILWLIAGKRIVLPLLTVLADSLERLELYYLYFDLDHNEVKEAFTALGRLKNLRQLSMTIQYPAPHGTAALAFMNGGLPKLRVLDLQEGWGLDDDTVIAISHGCPALRKLILSYCERLSDVAFSQIHHLKHLETLDVSYCKGLGGSLICFLARLPQLHTLVMEKLEFPKLLPGLSSIIELSSLRCLTLNRALITGVPFHKFPGKLVNLRKLNVSGCRGDPKATDGLAEQMPHLEIHGSIEAEQSASNPEEHENDAEPAEEENEENAGPGDADEARTDSLERDEDGDSDDDIWDESTLSSLFLEKV